MAHSFPWDSMAIAIESHRHTGSGEVSQKARISPRIRYVLHEHPGPENFSDQPRVLKQSSIRNDSNKGLNVGTWSKPYSIDDADR
jgi:hypothetical protein